MHRLCWRGRLPRCDPLPHHGPVGPFEVTVLGLGFGSGLPVRNLDLLFMDRTLRVDVVARLTMFPRRFSWRRSHRDHYVAGLLKVSACVCIFAAKLEALAYSLALSLLCFLMMRLRRRMVSLGSSSGTTFPIVQRRMR